MNPCAGEIRLGGVSVDRLPLDACRRRIAVAPQNPHLFAATVRDNLRLGRPEATDAEIEAELERQGLAWEKLSEQDIVDRAARAMHANRVVGWFQGRMEFGPRALGNRSMVAAPTDREINRTLNERLDRTEFMPFAPSVLAERAEALFDNVPPCAHTAEFMTITCDVKPEWHERIPAVVHVDGTARPQLVRADRNPLYHALISRYAELSGIPVVLNTSFNVHEEPIVCGPEEGIRALAEDRIDDLAIGRPDLDWVAMARGMGVEAARAKTCEQLVKGLNAGLRSQGPYLVEVAV